MEYHGELMDEETANEREAQYKQDESIGSFMYDFTFKGKKYW